MSGKRAGEVIGSVMKRARKKYGASSEAYTTFSTRFSLD